MPLEQRIEQGAYRLYQVLHTVIRLMLILLLVIAIAQALLPQHAALADDGGGGGSATQESITTLKEIMGMVASWFIQVLYYLMFLAFGVGLVFSTASANFLLQLGVPHGLANTLIRVALGIVLFAFGVISKPLAEDIMQRMAARVSGDYSINVPLK